MARVGLFGVEAFRNKFRTALGRQKHKRVISCTLGSSQYLHGFLAATEPSSIGSATRKRSSEFIE